MLILVQGDIKEVHWAFYTRRPQDESALPNSQSSDKEEDLANYLHLFECTLREDGRHVLLDKDNAGAWVFSLSQAVDEGIVRTLSLDGFESENSLSLFLEFVLIESNRYIHRICQLGRPCYKPEHLNSIFDQNSALCAVNR